MKWINKGHQFDELTRQLKRRNRILIYGAGAYGDKCYNEYLHPLLQSAVVGFIDRDEKKQQSGFNGHRVYSPEILFSEHDETHLIIVAMIGEKAERLINRLEKAGYVKNWDFYMYNAPIFSGSLNDVFMPVFSLAALDKVYVTSGCIVPDTHCNLNCKDCLNFTPYIKKHIRRRIDELIDDINLYFKWVDFSERYQISGGEPLLYPDIIELVKYIGENYRERINIFEIVINGTIVPSDGLCDAMSKYNMTVYLDNYTDTIPSELSHRSEIISKLSKYGVRWIDNTVKNWFSLDIEHTDNSQMTDSQLEEYFDRCNNPWHCFENGKMYSCNFSRFAMKAGIISEENNDFFDFRKITEKKRMELLEFMLGYTQKGYVDFCKKCAAWGPANKNIVPVAIQLGNDEDINV